MPEDGDNKVNYNDYKYKGYEWHEDGRKDLPPKKPIVEVLNKKTSINESKPVKKEKKRTFDKQGAFVAIMMLMCFSVTFLLAELLGGGSALKLFSAKPQESKKYYAVAIDKYSNESIASISADELRKLGGGGFVIYNDEYYLLTSAYKSKQDAETVAKRLTSFTASVYEISFPEPNLDWCKTSDKKTVTEVLTYVDVVFDGLYDISVNLDKANISEDVAFSRIISLNREFKKLTSKLDNITVKEDNFNLIRLKAELTAVDAYLNNLQNKGLARYNLVSDVRYTMLAILFGYKNLTANI